MWYEEHVTYYSQIISVFINSGQICLMINSPLCNHGKKDMEGHSHLVGRWTLPSHRVLILSSNQKILAGSNSRSSFGAIDLDVEDPRMPGAMGLLMCITSALYEKDWSRCNKGKMFNRLSYLYVGNTYKTTYPYWMIFTKFQGSLFDLWYSKQ